MADTYRDIFQERGASYDRAMRRYPKARDEEFRALIDSADIQPLDAVCDFPSGGNYLPRYLPESVDVYAVEQCPQFISKPHGTTGSQVIISNPEKIGIKSNSMDCFVSLAGIHHIENKMPLFKEMQRILKPGGRFCIGDVYSGSPVEEFLDTIVDQYNSQRHHGAYLNDSTCGDLRLASLQIDAFEIKKYGWNFENRQQLIEFCSLLFRLDKIEAALFYDATASILGIDQKAQGCRMHWELLFISGTATEPGQASP
ncbi:hypothetical protein MNBD_GAMMA15-1894 [hydrothermal vent metagenome]|uniref:Methyltransferase type 11 domain-containing protein n=1 Tax=hydrothermal vent metagenome TaxID=652676 RepID=A0A3B0XWK6_9ZZZZ